MSRIHGIGAANRKAKIEAREAAAQHAAERARRREALTPGRRFRRAATLALWLGLGAVSVGSIRGPIVEAGTISVGGGPKDTVIRPDGERAYVLNSTASTISVVNTSSSYVTNTVNLAQGSGVCKDIDWQPGTNSLIVGCTNGKILSANPMSGFVSTLVTVSGASFDVVCADTYSSSGILAWAVDTSSGWLYSISSGSASAVVNLSLSTYTELVEKTRGASSSSLDSMIYALGASGSQVSVVSFDRSTSLVGGTVNLPLTTSTPTGLATSAGSEAYVTANNGSSGYLYALDLSSFAFGSSALDTYSSSVLDVSVAGQWVVTLTPLSSGTGANLQVYDAGDPAAVLKAGTLQSSSTVNAASGLAITCSDGALDGVWGIYANNANSATSTSFLDLRDSFVNVTPATVASGLEPTFQTTTSGIADQEARACAECGGQTGVVLT